MKKLNLFFFLLLALSIMQSCQKDENTSPTDEVAPELPPQATFIMPFDGYEEVDTTEFNNEIGNRSMTYRNWFYAGTNILVWNTLVGINMIVPVASFAESFNHDPVYEGNGIFSWTYSYPVAGVTYEAKLTGEFINSGADVEWIMTISQVGGFSNVVYYSGIVAVDGSKADWTLYHEPNNPKPFMRIIYLNDVNTGESSIRYTNIIPNNPGNGHYLEYRIQSGSAFNRAYDVFLGSPDNFIEILWNTPSDTGRVKNLTAFGDSEWHCWDIDKMDVDCQ